MVKVHLAMPLFVRLAVSVSAQESGRRPPRFEDYPVKAIFKGQPANPVLSTPEQRLYRTRIREGAAKGRGVGKGSWKYAEDTPGPNFAGHYVVIRWGCGADCLMMAVVDAETGKVYAPPMSGVGTELEVPMDIMSDKEIDFRLDTS